MNKNLENLSVAVRLVVVGILIFSIAYPLMVGIFGQVWSNSARGSLIRYENEIVGSDLIGQDFDDPRFFHGRPSSIDYNAMKSGSRNLGPNNPVLAERVRKTLEKISENRRIDNLIVPSILVTESGSALDPHITVISAMFQVLRVSQNTGISKERLRFLIKKRAEEPLLGIYGLRRVNVLQLNIEVKKLLEENTYGE